jgi:hypothetical protein
MSYPSCSPADPAALRADLNSRIVVAKDCADLARIILDLVRAARANP